jgi:hypothetical protein
MAPYFLSVMWHGKTIHGLGVQDVKSLILVDTLFTFDGGRRREGKKKKKKKSLWGREEGFLGSGIALLSVQWVTAVKCN